MVERSLSMREVAGSMPAFSMWRNSLDELLRLTAAEKFFSHAGLRTFLAKAGPTEI